MHVLRYIYVFFTLFGYWPGGPGGIPKGLVHNLLVQFFTLGSSKIEVCDTSFFDTVTTRNEHPRYVKHVLGRIYVVSTLFWGCVARGRFCARWTASCASYVKHVLAPLYVFFTLFGCAGGGGSH